MTDKNLCIEIIAAYQPAPPTASGRHREAAARAPAASEGDTVDDGWVLVQSPGPQSHAADGYGLAGTTWWQMGEAGVAQVLRPLQALTARLPHPARLHMPATWPSARAVVAALRSYEGTGVLALPGAMAAGALATVAPARAAAARQAFLAGGELDEAALDALIATLIEARATGVLTIESYAAITLLLRPWTQEKDVWRLDEGALRAIKRRALFALHPDKLAPMGQAAAASPSGMASGAPRAGSPAAALAMAQRLREVYDLTLALMGDPGFAQQAMAWSQFTPEVLALWAQHAGACHLVAQGAQAAMAIGARCPSDWQRLPREVAARAQDVARRAAGAAHYAAVVTGALIVGIWNNRAGRG